MNRFRGRIAAQADTEWFVLCATASSSSQPIVGESRHQPCLDKTIRDANEQPPFDLKEWPFKSDPEPRPWFAAYLQREPSNRYDANAVVVTTEHGLVGYLAREKAKSYQPVLRLLEPPQRRLLVLRRAAAPL